MKSKSKGNVKNLKPFPKGKSGNPAGRPPDVLGKAIRQLTASEFAELANLVIKRDLMSLQAIGKEQGASALKVWIAAGVVKAIQKGDLYTLDIFLNRVIGRVKEKIEVTGVDGGPLQTESKLAVEKLLSDPESFAHLSALEGKLNGKPTGSNTK